MEPQLVLQRIETQTQSGSQAFSKVKCSRTADGSHFPGVAKWDINHPFQLGMVGSTGILQMYTLETTRGGSKAYLYPSGSFQLHLEFGPSESCEEYEDASYKMKRTLGDKNDDAVASLCLGPGGKFRVEETTRAKPVEKAWGSLEFIPQRPGEIVFFQRGSRRILFARLPGSSPGSLPASPRTGERRAGRSDLSRRSKVYCLGRHSSNILSIAVRGDGMALVSAARDGYLKVWSIWDGSLLAQTMFSRWRQPRSPRQAKGKNAPFGTNQEEDEMDQMSSTMQVVRFLGDSWNFCMGCPHGEVRMWSLQDCETDRLTIAEVGSLVVGKEVVSALALHVLDCNYPKQSKAGDHPAQEFIAIGTISQNLQVWRKPSALDEWIPLWSTTLSVQGASIVSLSFRADGGLLAVAVSRLAKPIAAPESTSHHGSRPSSLQEQRPGDRLYLYNTSSWACVGWLSFASHLGSCLFYNPQFQVEDKSAPSSDASQLKVSSCRLLLLSTSGGPQTHILPEYGLFGTLEQSEQFEMTHLNCRKEAKSVHRMNFKRTIGPQFHVRYKETKEQELSKVEGEGDGSGCCSPSPMPVESGIGTESVSHSSDLGIQNYSFSPKANKRLPKQEMPYEEIGLQGLRRATFEKSNSYCQSHLHKPKSKSHPRKTDSKERRPKLETRKAQLRPRRLTTLKKHKSEKQFPLDFARGSCQHCKKRSWSVGSSQSKQGRTAPSSRCASFSNLASISLPSPTRVGNGGQDESLVNAGSNADVPSVEEPCWRTAAIDVKAPNKPKMPVTHALHRHKLKDQLNSKIKKVVTFIAPKAPQTIANHVRSHHCNLEGTVSQSRRNGEEGHLSTLSTNTKTCSPKKENQKNCNHQKATKGEEIRCNISGSEPHCRIGGEELHELLVLTENSSPLENIARMGGTFREMSPLSKSLVFVDSRSKQPEDKLGLEFNSPKAFSSTNLMQRLQDIEHETFDLDAALQVAKAKGMVLNKYDRAELKAALKEVRRDGLPKCEPTVEGQKSTARYIPLLKIPDPRTSHTGPYVAPRKVKKQIDTKGEDMSSIHPGLLDLWDLNERCPQVSSANLEQANTFSVSSWRTALGSLKETNRDSVWVQREDVCQAASTAQAMYDSCLHRPNIEPQCHCYESDHENHNIHVR